MKISFVTPVYNGEKTIKRMTDALLAEKEQDFELIIVDDGSKDGTYAVLEEIAASDSRVKIMHTENHGQSIARNYGISMVSGDYVGFIDADDCVNWDGVKKVINAIDNKNIDIICGLYYKFDEKGVSTSDTDLPEGYIEHDTDPASLYNIVKTRSLFGYCWNKFYRRGFFDESGVLFDDIRKVYMEDTLFNYKLFAAKPVYKFVPVPFYEYHNEDSVTTKKHEPMLSEKFCCMLETYGTYLDEKEAFGENLDLFLPLAMRVFCWSLFKTIADEGNHFARIRYCVNTFLGEEYFMRAIRDSRADHYIDYIPSGVQKLAYKFFRFNLAHGQKWIVELAFFFGYPVMKAYVGKLFM